MRWTIAIGLVHPDWHARPLDVLVSLTGGEVRLPFADFFVDEVRQVCSLMWQQEKILSRAVDATIKKAKSSGIARICVVLAILVLCSSEKGAALDPTSHISQYGHTVWRLQDGYFGGATPTSVTHTKDGYIWVGTVAGLYRFDGVRFCSKELLVRGRVALPAPCRAMFFRRGA